MISDSYQFNASALMTRSIHLCPKGKIMAIIVVSDVHGSTNWKNFVARANPEDQVIFLGDYFDLRGSGPFAPSQAKNFLEICVYARQNPGTVMLVGNHDYNYLYRDDIYYRDNLQQEYANVLWQNLDLLKVIHVSHDMAKPVIFAHGGLTATFMRLHNLKSIGEVNELWRQKPTAFDWLPNDPETGAYSDNYGDDPWQPPTWVRETALEKDAPKGFNQVVGHTPVRKPLAFSTANGDEVLMTCTLDNQFIRLPATERYPYDSFSDLRE